jgi:hypothetical protein
LIICHAQLWKIPQNIKEIDMVVIKPDNIFGENRFKAFSNPITTVSYPRNLSPKVITNFTRVPSFNAIKLHKNIMTKSLNRRQKLVPHACHMTRHAYHISDNGTRVLRMKHNQNYILPKTHIA